MITIRKHHLEGQDRLKLTRGSKLLHIGEQDGSLMLWFQVDDEAPAEERVFKVYGTGWRIEEPDRVVHELDWHVYEVIDNDR